MKTVRTAIILIVEWLLQVLPRIFIGWFFSLLAVGIYQRGQTGAVVIGGTLISGVMTILLCRWDTHFHSGKRGIIGWIVGITGALSGLAFFAYSLALVSSGWNGFENDRVMTLAALLAFLSIGALATRHQPPRYWRWW